MIVFYSKDCEGCTGNHALSKMESHCNSHDIEFEERRTILWKRFEEEAQEIMELNKGLTLPFFYNTETGGVLKGNSFTSLEEVQNLAGFNDKHGTNREP